MVLDWLRQNRRRNTENMNYLVDAIGCLCYIREGIIEVKDDINRGITVHNYDYKAADYAKLFEFYVNRLKEFTHAYKNSEDLMERETLSYLTTMADYFGYYVTSLTGTSKSFSTFNYIRDSIKTMTLMINVRLNHCYEMLRETKINKY